MQWFWWINRIVTPRSARGAYTSYCINNRTFGAAFLHHTRNARVASQESEYPNIECLRFFFFIKSKFELRVFDISFFKFSFLSEWHGKIGFWPITDLQRHELLTVAFIFLEEISHIPPWFPYPLDQLRYCGHFAPTLTSIAILERDITHLRISTFPTQLRFF